MQYTKISFSDAAGMFSSFFLDYIDQKETLSHFYHRFPALPAFTDQIEDKKKSFSNASRQVLQVALKNQYRELTRSKIVDYNLEALKNENTFTITTGHQLNIFTGPLYVIYKIVSTINLCKQLKKTYPDYTFVPLYWMASEDHDFEEINHFRLYGKKYTWETPQQGAVGRFDPQGLSSLLKKIPGDLSPFKEGYLSHTQLSDAVRFYINALFGEEGLLIVDADCRSLKSLLREVITDDLFNHTPKQKVEESNSHLISRGYTPQIHARDINFFYLDKALRERIESVKDKLVVTNTDIGFEKTQIKELIQKEPEKFSPNVVIRPLYQELILPNLAYIGGPSEVVYWLQLKEMFAHYQVPFPILVPRNFAVIVNGPTARKIKKTGFAEPDLFQDIHQLHAQWVRKNAPGNLSLSDERETTKSLFEKIKKKAQQIDVTLEALIAAEEHRVIDRLEQIEKKFIRTEKKKHTDVLNQINSIKKSLFPDGSPQERRSNFLNFYQEDPHFIKKIMRVLDPLDFRLNVVSYPFV